MGQPSVNYNTRKQIIKELCITHKIHAALTGYQDGPATETWILSLTRDVSHGLKELRKLDKSLAHIMKVEGVRVAEAPDGVHIEITKPAHMRLTPNGFKLASKASDGQRTAVGLDIYGQPVFLRVVDHGAIAFLGAPGRGKTQAMKAFLYSQLINVREARFMVIALAKKIQDDWEVFRSVPGCLGLVSHPDEMEAALGWAVHDMSERSVAHPTYVVVDDVTALDMKSLGGLMGDIAVAGRAIGYHLILGSHFGGAKEALGGQKVDGSTTARICFGVADKRLGAATTGLRDEESGLSGLSKAPGDAIFVEHQEPKRIATAWIDDNAIRAISTTWQPPAPWPTTTTAPQPKPVASQPQTVAATAPQPPATATNRSQPSLEGGLNGQAWQVMPPSADPVVAVGSGCHFPIEKRPPEESEAGAIRQMYLEGMSLTKMTKAVYGFKDGDTFNWIKEVIHGDDE